VRDLGVPIDVEKLVENTEGHATVLNRQGKMATVDLPKRDAYASVYEDGIAEFYTPGFAHDLSEWVDLIIARASGAKRKREDDDGGTVKKAHLLDDDDDDA